MKISRVLEVVLAQIRLIYLLDLIRGNTFKGQFTGMIMLDLQKSFDTVNRDILCDKLKAMGVMSTEWFSSYLTY